MESEEKKEMNLELRSFVLELALKIEHNIDMMLLCFLNIEAENRKAITNKSGNLSFKNKIDLLYDLEIINKEEHGFFQLLMEFRNQFMHNIKCSSFVYATEILGVDKKKNLLKFHPSSFGSEEDLRIAYQNLFDKNIDIIIEKLKARTELLIEKKLLVRNLSKSCVLIVDFIKDFSCGLVDKCLPKEGDSEDVVSLKNYFSDYTKTEMKKLYKSEELLSMLDDVTIFANSDKLNKLFH